MKALVVRQPWANLIASGKKTVETRTWTTSYRGDIVIVAGKELDHAAVAHFKQYEADLKGRGIELYGPLGVTVCVAKLVRVQAFDPIHEQAAMCQAYIGGWAWVLENIRKTDRVPVRGKLGIFELGIEPALLNVEKVVALTSRRRPSEH